MLNTINFSEKRDTQPQFVSGIDVLKTKSNDILGELRRSTDNPDEIQVLDKAAGALKEIFGLNPDFNGVIRKFAHATPPLSKFMKEYPPKDFPKLLLLLLYSNVVIQADEIGEMYFDKVNRGEKQRKSTEKQVANAFELSAGTYTDSRTGVLTNLTLREVLTEVIPYLEQKTGQERIEERQSLFSQMIQSQVWGMNLVEKFATQGIPYAKSEAFTYLKGTIGNYNRLLASIFTSDPVEINEYVKDRIADKLEDDRSDILIDILSQPNIYLAILFETGDLHKIRDLANSMYRKLSRVQQVLRAGGINVQTTPKKFAKIVGKLVEKMPGIAESYKSVTKSVLEADLESNWIY